jgi:hypothetical protein
VDPIGANVLSPLLLALWFPARRVCSGGSHLQCVLDVHRLALLPSALGRQVGQRAATAEGDEAAQGWWRAMRPLYEPDSVLRNARVVAVGHCHGSWGRSRLGYPAGSVDWLAGMGVQVLPDVGECFIEELVAVEP